MVSLIKILILLFIPFFIVACSQVKYSEKNMPDIPSYCTTLVSEGGNLSEAALKLGVLFEAYDCSVHDTDRNSLVISVFKNHDLAVDFASTHSQIDLVSAIDVGEIYSDDSDSTLRMIDKKSMMCGDAEIFYFIYSVHLKEAAVTIKDKHIPAGEYVGSTLTYAEDNLYIEIHTNTMDQSPHEQFTALTILKDMGYVCNETGLRHDVREVAPENNAEAEQVYVMGDLIESGEVSGVYLNGLQDQSTLTRSEALKNILDPNQFKIDHPHILIQPYWVSGGYTEISTRSGVVIKSSLPHQVVFAFPSSKVYLLHMNFTADPRPLGANSVIERIPKDFEIKGAYDGNVVYYKKYTGYSDTSLDVIFPNETINLISLLVNASNDPSEQILLTDLKIIRIEEEIVK